MSTKTTFKRIALVAVAALGLGVLSVAPSSAAIVASSDTLTVSGTSSAIVAGETASVTVTQAFIAAAAGDSMTVRVTNQIKPAGASAGTLGLYVTDSSNATIFTSAQHIVATAGAGTWTECTTDCQSDYFDNAGTALGTDISASAGGTTALSATYRLSFMAPTTVGTYTFRIYAVNGPGNSQAIAATPLTWTVTVSANTADTTSAAKTVTYLNAVAEYTSGVRGKKSEVFGFKPIEADSALVVSAGTAATNTAYAVLSTVVKNASDTNIGSTVGTRLTDSVTVVMTGPGLLGVYSWGNSVGTLAKQVTLSTRDTVVVYSDGTAGVGTITTYLGSTASVANVLTQAAKTITFVGRATTFTLTGPVGATTYKSSDTATGGLNIISFVAKDAAGNAVNSAALNASQGEGAFYAISSDTSILTALNNRTSPALACSYSTADAYWTCTGNVFDSGTVTLTVVDSRTLTEGGKILTSTTAAVNKSSALSITVAGTGYTGTIAFDKSTYTAGEAATLTLTSKDSGGRAVATGTSNPFTSIAWASASPNAFTSNSSLNAAGGTFTSLTDYLASGTTFVGGVDTAMVFMPTQAGTYVLQGKTSGATNVSTILTFTIADPTKDAADAATDAALEATDAAYAAQDAAQLAAEAADAATAAAEAATAAVEDLATQVASLFADLQKQITTLANVVAKIAKKVKA